MAAARGLIIVIPLLIAAGVAVYESPQVRQFLEEHRRKIALALNDLGDQFGQGSGSQSGPPRPQPRRATSRDIASAQEDKTPEAEERRRQFRQEIMERRRVMEQRRGIRHEPVRRGSSFDHLVDTDGNLRGNASGTDGAFEMGTLRRRRNEAAGAALGATFANPFSDEMAIDQDHGVGVSDEDLARQLQAHFDEEYATSQNRSSMADRDAPLTVQEVQELERIVREAAEQQGKELPEPGSKLNMSEADLLNSLHQLEADLGSDGEDDLRPGRMTPTTSTAPSMKNLPPMPFSETHSEGEGVLVDASSTHPSETPLIDFTPTTSAPGTPRQAPRQPTHQQSYQSIQDWAEQSTASFHSLYDSSVGVAPHEEHDDVSELESLTARSEVGSEMDAVSELGISTPGTWTEVGSVVSAEDHNNQNH